MKILFLKTKEKIMPLLGMALLVIFGTSCHDDLEPVAFSQIDTNTFFQTESDAAALTNAFYSEFDNGWTGRWWDNQGITTAGVTAGDLIVLWGGFESRERFTWDAADGRVAFNYDQWIGDIAKATNAIADIERIDIDETVKNEYIAQVRVGRALMLFFLYDQYGPVPMVVDPEITQDINTDFVPTRPTKEEAIKFIDDELKAAEASLPPTYAGGDFGRLGAGAAKMTRLKLYMHEKRWTDAIAVAQEIENLGIYSLMPGENYGGIWLDEGNSEIIWSLGRLSNNGIPQHFMANVLPGDFRDESGNSYVSWNGWRLNWEIFDSFDPGDARLSLLAEDYLVEDGSGGLVMKEGRPAGDPAGVAQGGALIFKYGGLAQNFDGANGDGDVVIYRYSDMLLLWAEALNENGDTPGARMLLQRVRARAGVDALTPALTSQNEMRDYLLEERFRELHVEGWGRQDLIRNGTFISAAQARGHSNAQDFHVLYPIPQSAIDANPQLTQNPGYGGN